MWIYKKYLQKFFMIFFEKYLEKTFFVFIFVVQKRK